MAKRSVEAKPVDAPAAHKGSLEVNQLPPQENFNPRNSFNAPQRAAKNQPISNLPPEIQAQLDQVNAVAGQTIEEASNAAYAEKFPEAPLNEFDTQNNILKPTVVENGQVQPQPVAPPQAAPTPPTEPAPPVAPPVAESMPKPANPLEEMQEAKKQIEDLNKNIEEAELEEASSPKALGAFGRLKSYYKKQNKELLDKLAKFEETASGLEKERAALGQTRTQHESFEELKTKYEAQRQTLENQDKELQETRYYKRLADAKSDPVLQRNYLQPMDDAKQRALNILESVNVTDVPFEELSKSSEFEINNYIESTGLSGMNANALKGHLDNYFMHKSGYAKETNKENLEGTLKRTQAQMLESSDRLADEVLGHIKKSFSGSNFVKELSESDFNKDHNVFVHDKILEKANDYYQKSRKRLGEKGLDPHVLSECAESALAKAAYPYNEATTRFLMQENAALKAENRALTTGPDITQTTEVAPVDPYQSQLDYVRKISEQTIEESNKSLFE